MNESVDNGIYTSFSYEIFDRQLHNFMQMVEVLMDGWEDLSGKEMTFDILSLSVKASKLCYMADQDLALQHGDATQQRKAENEELHHRMEGLVRQKLSAFVLGVVNGVKEGKMLTGHESPMASFQLSHIFPRISDLLLMEGMTKEKMQELNGLILMMENMVGEEAPLLSARLSATPGDSLGQESPSEDASGMEMMLHLWNVLRLYALTSYLLLHFRRVCHVTSRPLEADVAIRLTESKVQKYMSEGEGRHQLELYQARLQYENDGNPLSVEQWLKARRELKNLVPAKFELTFFYYANDAGKAGDELVKLSFTPEEFDLLVDALAKYQLITRRIYEVGHPEEQTHTLPNEAFNWVVNGKNVDMQELRKSIGKMAALVKRKNQWFCVWSVLKHLNVLRDDCNFATFAHQMMSREWLGDTENIIPFSADNLSDYSHYFNEYDYTDWTEEMFLEKKELYGMTKWSPKLYATFSSLCDKMMKAIWGYRFLGMD